MSLLFIVGAIMAVAGATGVLVARNPVHSVLAMVVNFVALALLYLGLTAEFMAVIQLIISAGAIMVLFLFVIALLTTGLGPAELEQDRLPMQVAIGFVVSGLLVVFVAAGTLADRVPLARAVAAGFGTVANFGQQLLTTHLLAFELIAFVLMVAVVGVVLIVGGRNDQERA